MAFPRLDFYEDWGNFPGHLTAPQIVGLVQLKGKIWERDEQQRTNVT